MRLVVGTTTSELRMPKHIGRVFAARSPNRAAKGRNSQSTLHRRNPLKTKPSRNPRAEHPGALSAPSLQTPASRTGASSYARFFTLISNLQPRTSRTYPRQRTSTNARILFKIKDRVPAYPRQFSSRFSGLASGLKALTSRTCAMVVEGAHVATNTQSDREEVRNSGKPRYDAYANVRPTKNSRKLLNVEDGCALPELPRQIERVFDDSTKMIMIR